MLCKICGALSGLSSIAPDSSWESDHSTRRIGVEFNFGWAKYTRQILSVQIKQRQCGLRETRRERPDQGQFCG